VTDTYTIQNPALQSGEDDFGIHLLKNETYSVSVTWFFLDPTRWESQLKDSDLKNALRSNSEFSNFPHYKTFQNRFWYLSQPTPRQVSALAHMTSAIVFDNRCALEKLFESDQDKGQP
jgi:hypothetical protein